MDTDKHGFEDPLTEVVLGAAFEVANTLGPGFLEKVYERALLRELATRGVKVDPQVVFEVIYKGHCVGEYVPDILVGDRVLVELKCVDRFTSEHAAQCLNYLRAAGKATCLLINFQKPKVEWRRFVL